MTEARINEPLDKLLDLGRHPINDASYRLACARELARTGVLVLTRFLSEATVRSLVREFSGREEEAFYASTTHNVWLTPQDATLDPAHVFNRQIRSSKGLLADDQISDTSPLKQIYGHDEVRSFLAEVVGAGALHPYSDALSSVNLHFHRDGEELGWHFDNSSFAVTALIQAPESGGTFEFVPSLRDAGSLDQNFDGVEQVLDGQAEVHRLTIDPGDLVIFRGRDALHRVTPSVGSTTRMLAVLAFNGEPGVSLSESAMQTFYGRTK